MESPVPQLGGASLPAGEKTLDAVLSLLETVRCITSIATIGHPNDAKQTLAVGSAPAQADTKAPDDDAQVRIAVLESELKQERAANAVTLSNLQQVIQLYAPTTIEHPVGQSAGFEKTTRTRNLQQQLDEARAENEQLRVRFLSTTPPKSGFVEPGSVPETPEKPHRDGISGSPTRNEGSFVKRSPESPLDFKTILNNGVTEVDVKGTSDHLHELPHDFSTTEHPVVSNRLLDDLMDDGFCSLEDLLGRDDGFGMSSKKGLRNLDSIMGSAVNYRHAPGILEVGLDASRGRRANTAYTLGPVDRFRDYDRRYADRRPRHYGIDRHEPATDDDDAYETHRSKIVPGDNPRPDYFKYGLQFKPPLSDFRTVHIGNLPAGITKLQLMSRVRGGQIVSVTICDTIKLTQSMSALVVFLYADAAAAYTEFAKSHPIVFESRTAIVTLLKTSTWPLSKPIYRRIIEQGQTRCLAILAFSRPGLSAKSLAQRVRDVKRQIYRDKRYRAYRESSLENMELGEDDRLCIHFSSVYAATLAFDILKNPRNYGNFTITFEKDPCSRSLDDLLAPAGPKGDMKERFPTDGDDLLDLDADDSSDMDAKYSGHRRIARPRYRDADRSPSGKVDELSYSDVNNVVVPQFGGPMIQPTVTKETTQRVAAAGPVSSSPRRRSWADEVNGESYEEEIRPVTPKKKEQASSVDISTVHGTTSKSPMVTSDTNVHLEESFAFLSQEPIDLLLNSPEIPSMPENLQSHLPLVPVSLSDDPEGTTRVTAIPVQNPDEIDLNVDVDLKDDSFPTPPPASVKGEAIVGIINVTIPDPSLPLTLVPVPCSITAPKLRPKMSVPSTSPPRPTPTTALDSTTAPIAKPRKSFRGPGLATSKYATLIPGYKDTPAPTGIKTRNGMAEINGAMKENEGIGAGERMQNLVGIGVGISGPGMEPQSSATKGRKIIKYGDDNDDGEDSKAIQIAKPPAMAKLMTDVKRSSTPPLSSTSSPSLPSDVAEDLAANSGSEGC